MKAKQEYVMQFMKENQKEEIGEYFGKLCQKRVMKLVKEWKIETGTIFRFQNTPRGKNMAKYATNMLQMCLTG